MILLVNLNYDLSENDQGHIVYSVPEDRIDDAKTAVETAQTAWFSSEDGKTIDEFIEDEFKSRNIRFELLEYDVISLDMNNY